MPASKTRSFVNADPNQKEQTTSRSERITSSNSQFKPMQSAQKSFIPTYRSVPQTPRTSAMTELSKTSLDYVDSERTDDIRSSLLEPEMLSDFHTVDEFKDCLDSVKLDMETSSRTDIDTLNLGTETAEEILKNLKTPDELDASKEVVRPPTRDRSPKLRERTIRPPNRDISPNLQQRAGGKGSAPIRCLSRKNSSSGIPVSLSLSNKPLIKSPVLKPITRRLGGSPGGVSPTHTTGSPPGNKRHLASTDHAEKAPNTSIAVKKNLDAFMVKKRRYDTIRKDVQIRQKPLTELYNALTELKVKLDHMGEHVTIDPLPQFDTQIVIKAVMQSVEVAVNDGSNNDLINVDYHILDEVTKTVENLCDNSVALCKNMMRKRSDLLTAFESMAKLDLNSHMLLHELELHQNESVDMNEFLDKAIEQQEVELKKMVVRMAQLKVIPAAVLLPRAQLSIAEQQTSQLSVHPPAEPIEDVSSELQESLKELKENQAKYKQLEKQLLDTQADLKIAQDAIAADLDSGDALRNENDKLKNKINSLEKQIDSEKRKAAHEVDRSKTTEMSSKNLRAKIKELETAKLQLESKISQLSSDLRSAQSKLKAAEKNFDKELTELNKSRSLDKSVIERLNRDKSTFETRLSMATQQTADLRAEFEERNGKMRQDVELARQECDVHAKNVNHLRVECERLKNELNTVHMHAQQSSELLRRKDDNRSPLTERECELQIEVVAQRAAIKALQEKVDSNAMEKIRFIETIEVMNGSSERRDELVKTLVQKEEDITQLHQLMKKRDDDLANRRIEVQNLKAKVDNLEDHIQAMKQQCTDADLKNMIKEGRNKLEDALAKSLENEHKLIQFEHEMAQKIQTVAHLENTLKLRDGLIGVLKSKKEELAMENKSLCKYSDEVRKFVIEAKEELKEKTEIITQLQLALNDKLHESSKLEKRLQQMENQLTLTNEKRYRLQDTVSLMERELHMAKTGLESGGDIRYDDQHSAATAVGQEINFSNIKDDGQVKIKITVS